VAASSLAHCLIWHVSSSSSGSAAVVAQWQHRWLLYASPDENDIIMSTWETTLYEYICTTRLLQVPGTGTPTLFGDSQFWSDSIANNPDGESTPLGSLSNFIVWTQKC
jgi:hypothetical protein